MKTLSLGYFVAVAATLVAISNVGQAQPLRLARRDPVTKILKYVLYGDHPSYHEPSYSPSVDEREVLCLVNKERRRIGLHALTLHPAMTQAAFEHSEYQSRVRSMTHSDPQNGQLGDRLQRNGFKFASASENIAEGKQLSAKEVFNMWMNDPPHYENIVDPNATYMGLACVNGFWTQDFGSSSESKDYSPKYEVHEHC
ncbi:hypothetical protein GGI25_003604 [Coemansia spiralis]|uniref:SCP domain-containing protein n=2 Tax=Coemansia TaxID=4863 RepID=A0A9W8G6T7_9FUNG|nr:hypothetical protein BX070DRAFT_235765 [Coemansia spiralis]KAJ1991160.1 hypothetical protein EDC05_003638 [Coemansia umbellata]KAJ2621263.1 hypothetical protein GGI26_004237 [Coemansia sp. RSA 1358]KAJ2676454.1 hypothetical protein GGI25_003604 [Coemansia spiralis]